MLMGIKEIKEILPHRHPFLLVDCIEELVPGERAVGYKNLTYDESFFAGHFPDEPVMPGVLIVEALAQTGAVAVLCLYTHLQIFLGAVGYDFAEKLCEFCCVLCFFVSCFFIVQTYFRISLSVSNSCHCKIHTNL